MGGASIANQALRAGLVDELNLNIEPVLLGGGRTFDQSGPLEPERAWADVSEQAREPKAGKNRPHLDVQPDDRTRDEEVERVIRLGA